MIKYFKKRRKIIVFAIVVMAITMIPYLVGYSQQGDEWRYTGFVIGVKDGNSYIAKMLAGAEGNWLFRSSHSAVEQQGFIAFLPYIILGKLTSGPAQHEQIVSLYHLARFVFGILAILATYDFISIYLKKENLKWWALAFITLGGGLGWLLVSLNQKEFLASFPLEFISPESFGFLGIFGFPHLAAARALFFWGLTLFIKREKGYLSGNLWLVTGFFQPMVVVIAWVVIGSYIAAIILAKRFDTENRLKINADFLGVHLRKMFQSILVSAPIVLYTAYLLLFNPYFDSWTAQNRLASPHFFHYLVAYGLVMPFTIVGIGKYIKNQKIESLLLASWLFISPFLIYAPVFAQRRWSEGIWAVYIIGMIGNYTKEGKIPVAIQGIMALLLPSTLFILVGSIMVSTNPSEPAFRPAEEVQVYDFIAKNLDKDSVFLSTFEIGNNLPAWAPIKVVMGHGPETIGLNNIETEVSAIFYERELNLEDCRRMFMELKTDYLFWGPEEKSKWKVEPEDYDCLIPIYTNGDYSVYEVDYLDK